MDKKKSKTLAPAKAGKPSLPSDFYTLGEYAQKLKCSAITLRRRIVDGKCRGLVLMDPFGLGRPLITKDSGDAFIATRIQATAKEFIAAPHLHE